MDSMELILIGNRLFLEKKYDGAIQNLNQALESLEDKAENIRKQIFAQFFLGRCYLEQNKQNNSDKCWEKSKDCFQQVERLSDLLTDKTEAPQHIIARSNQYLREIYFLEGIYPDYLAQKQAHIKAQLPHQQPFELQEAVASILAVLSISPIEFQQPLAHYTSPAVCEKLLGIGQKQAEQSSIAASKMRMNSSTYMNDPYEGKSLSDFLGIQELSLENQSEFGEYNAFFTCFSSRVNDLNQFRLYGKVDNIEASGCCLVFNKNGKWVEEPDISASYRPLNSGFERGNIQESDRTALSDQPSANLPLYQIAYIFYRDEYTKDDPFDIFEPDSPFGIRLKPISLDSEWEKVRREKLREALESLRTYLKSPTSEEQSKRLALEYIRYLFKDYAFRDEEEFRLLQIEKLDSEKVQYCSATNSVYLEYGDICHKLDEVILGTNYERTDKGLKVEVFRHLLKKKLPKIQVSHSSLPIHASGK